MDPGISIILPVLNESAGIGATLKALAPWREAGVEVIAVDGGSDDDTREQCQGQADGVITAARGRARQMNAGAALAQGELLLFLHADTRLPDGAQRALREAWAAGAQWGRFDVEISGQARMLRVVAAMMNWRSRWTGIATGDQAIFVRRALFEQLGGYPDQPLMEDVELSARLRRLHRPACLRLRVRTSGRRWEQRGVWRTIVLMWSLRLRYWLGTSPEVLVRAYR